MKPIVENKTHLVIYSSHNLDTFDVNNDFSPVHGSLSKVCEGQDPKNITALFLGSLRASDSGSRARDAVSNFFSKFPVGSVIASSDFRDFQILSGQVANRDTSYTFAAKVFRSIYLPKFIQPVEKVLWNEGSKTAVYLVRPLPEVEGTGYNPGNICGELNNIFEGYRIASSDVHKAYCRFKGASEMFRADIAADIKNNGVKNVVIVFNRADSIVESGSGDYYAAYTRNLKALALSLPEVKFLAAQPDFNGSFATAKLLSNLFLSRMQTRSTVLERFTITHPSVFQFEI